MKDKIMLLSVICMIAVLLFVSCGGGGAGAGTAASDAKESPMLAEKVAAGELPPLEERLPKEPALSLAAEVGKFGGIYRGAGFGPGHGQLDTAGLRFTGLIRLEPDLQTFTPLIAKSYESNADFTVWTITLREGMKWSDGAPFTSGDFKFWYEDIMQNPELTPTVHARHQAGGEPMKMAFPDDYTVVITFAAPYPAFDVLLASTYDYMLRLWFPRHYLEKWHVKYNPDADALAKSEGFESWAQAFNQHRDKTDAQTDINCPDLTPWVLSQVDPTGNKYFDRNPYYFVVDREGKQLPYIDQQISVIVADGQTRILKFAAGELHAAAENPLPVKDYTLYVQNETQGNYKTYLFANSRGSDNSFTFNITHKDPVLRKIFNDVKFREAMSLAINRQQINDVLFFGKADIRQAVPPASTSFVEDWMNTYMIEYDVEGANKRLDELGLVWNAAHTQRMRPDGQPFQIVLESTEEFTPMAEMVSEMWTAVGVKTDYKQNERTFARERFLTNERDAQCFTFDGAAEFALRGNTEKIRPAFVRDELGFASLYRQWYDTNGAVGEEPPQNLKDLRALVDEWQSLAPSNPQYVEKGKEMLGIFTRNLWYIGLSVAPRVVLISNTLGNAPTEGTFAYDYFFWYPYKGDSWYFK